MPAVSIDQMGRMFADIERSAAAEAYGAALDKSVPAQLRQALQAVRAREPDIETKCSVPDPAMQRLFMTLCEHCGIEPYRVPRQRKTSISVRAPRSFVQGVLWPTFNMMAKLLDSWLVEQTDAIIDIWKAQVSGGGGEPKA
jgi:hypothetical protein